MLANLNLASLMLHSRLEASIFPQYKLFKVLYLNILYKFGFTYSWRKHLLPKFTFHICVW